MMRKLAEIRVIPQSVITEVRENLFRSERYPSSSNGLPAEEHEHPQRNRPAICEKIRQTIFFFGPRRAKIVGRLQSKVPPANGNQHRLRDRREQGQYRFQSFSDVRIVRHTPWVKAQPRRVFCEIQTRRYRHRGRLVAPKRRKNIAVESRLHRAFWPIDSLISFKSAVRSSSSRISLVQSNLLSSRKGRKRPTYFSKVFPSSRTGRITV